MRIFVTFSFTKIRRHGTKKKMGGGFEFMKKLDTPIDEKDNEKVEQLLQESEMVVQLVNLRLQEEKMKYEDIIIKKVRILEV